MAQGLMDFLIPVTEKRSEVETISISFWLGRGCCYSLLLYEPEEVLCWCKGKIVFLCLSFTATYLLQQYFYHQASQSAEQDPDNQYNQDVAGKLEFLRNTQQLFSVCMHELIRQTAVQCVEQAEL